MSRGKKLAVKVVAGVLACVLVSTGSIAGFAALINGGYIAVGSSDSSSPAFTINKMVNEDDSDGSSASQTSTTGELSLNEIAEKVIPSVVCIQNYQKTNQGYYFGAADETEEDAGEGSGIIATEDGYIITNAHVVDGADSLKVVLYDGSTYEATLVGSDSVTDLAVIKIEATNLVPATFGSSEDLKVADQVMAIGNPGGLQFSSSVTVGYVSALNRTITTEDGYTMECIQTDAAINPGNSGGALVNKYGQVVGINSSKIAATGYEGLGFAIPIDTAQSVISSLKEYGYVKDRAVLGITGQYVDSMTARFYGYPSGGMYVASVTNPSVSQAGITQGCMITKIDDVTVDSQTAITAYLTSKKAGDTVTLEVYNGLSQQTFTAEVTLAESTGE
ncbi:MAG: trypsin [Clostridiales bacterium]|nr:trypsin-like peptidase domain-containing protein [Clostridiales bacterium]PWM41398.1 MAG: trypsin [Clostridiales bacterium]